MKSDAVVIGGGQNGLAAALILARKGLEVSVCEARAEFGGLAGSMAIHPEYRNTGLLSDHGVIDDEILKTLDLRRYGLTLRDKPPARLHLGSNGHSVTLPPRTEWNKADDSEPSDLNALSRLGDFVDRVSPLIRRINRRPPPELSPDSLVGFLGLLGNGIRLRLLGERDLLQLARVLPMAVADWTREYGQSDLFHAALSHLALDSSPSGPWSPGTAAILLLRLAAPQNYTIGGGAQLVRCLENACRDNAVTLRSSSEVAAINVNGNSVSGVTIASGETIEAPLVFSSLDPHRTFLELLPREHCMPSLDRLSRNYRMRGSIARLDIALDGLPEFSNENPTPEWLSIGDGLDRQEMAYDSFKYREASPEPLLDVRIPSLSDASLAPNGGHVMEVQALFVPQNIEGGWDDASRENLRKAIYSGLERAYPDLSERVSGDRLTIPSDVALEYGVTGGHLYHGEFAPDQLLSLRPNHLCSGYQTPVEGLRLCGASSHPGGGVNPAPGVLSAQEI